MYRITAVINKAGGAPVSWIYYSSRRLTQTQCENMLSLDNQAGRGYGFRVTLSEFSCEKTEDDLRVVQQTASQCPVDDTENTASRKGKKVP